MTHLQEYSEILTHSSNPTEQLPHRLPFLLNCALTRLLAKRIMNRAAHDVVSHDHRSTMSRSTSQLRAFAPRPTQAGISSQTHSASQLGLSSRDGTCARAVRYSLLSHPSYLLTCLTRLNFTLVRFMRLYCMAGKYWWYEVCAAAGIVVANVVLASWSANTPEWLLYTTLMPSVRPLPALSSLLRATPVNEIADRDAIRG